MSVLILYGFPQSTYVRTARMACEEKGVPYQLESVELRSEALTELHPFGKIPVLQHGDFVLYETPAIARYVDEAFDGQPLQPADPSARATMTQWISVIGDYVYDSAIRRYVLQFVFPRGENGKPDMTTIKAAIPDIAHHLGVIDQALEGRTYLLGEAPTLADLFLAPILFYIPQMPGGRDILGGCPNLVRSFAAMEARDSFAKTVPPRPGEAPA